MTQVQVVQRPPSVATKSPTTPQEGNSQSTPEPSSPCTPFLMTSPNNNNRNEDDELNVNTPPTKVGSMDGHSGAPVQPVLYSAIGSLENSSLSNMGSFQSRILKASAAASGKSGGGSGMFTSSSRLIPPSAATTTTSTHLPPLQAKQQQQVFGYSTFSDNENTKTTSWMHTSTALTVRKTVATASLQETKSITPPKAGLTSALESHAAAEAAAIQNTKLSPEETTLHNNTKDMPAELRSSGSNEYQQYESLEEKKMSGGSHNLDGQASQLDLEAGGGGILKKRSSFSRTDSDEGNSQGMKKTTSFDNKVSIIPFRNEKKMLTAQEDRKAPVKMEVFRPSCDAYTPRIQSRSNIPPYVGPESRRPVETSTGTMGTISRPNFRDALKRVAMILQQHITKIERRFDDSATADASSTNSSLKGKQRTLFSPEMRNLYCEDEYIIPRYKCTIVRLPIMSMSTTVITKKKIPNTYTIPTSDEIYEFAHQLFKRVQLSSECSIVCLIYVERLMEVARVPLLATTWRPIFMCGLLLASKVWQDLSSWNIEFASVYPQFSLEAINRLELQFVSHIKWDLYISSSLYAKYYFALRSLLEKKDFRQRYNRMVGGVNNVAESEALKVQQRTEMVKEEALMLLSRSME